MTVAPKTWWHMPPQDRPAFANKVGFMFSALRLDTSEIARDLNYPESIVSEALHWWRENRRAAA